MGKFCGIVGTMLAAGGAIVFFFLGFLLAWLAHLVPYQVASSILNVLGDMAYVLAAVCFILGIAGKRILSFVSHLF